MQRTGRAIYAIILSPGQKSRTDSGNLRLLNVHFRVAAP